MNAASRVAYVAAFGLTLGGCVTTSQYEAAQGERDRLRERNAQLDASVAALGAERDRLASELEDLRQSRDAATREAERLSGDCEARVAAQSAQLEQLHATYEALVKDLEAQLATGQSQIEQLREGLRTSLPAELLFTSGSVELTGEGERVLGDLAQRFREERYASYRIFVEGHTDGAAIHGALAQRFPTNWELAGARAARVVRALADAGVESARLVAVSLGAEHPLESNDTAEGRAANRRIEVRLLPLAAAPPADAAAQPANAPR